MSKLASGKRHPAPPLLHVLARCVYTCPTTPPAIAGLGGLNGRPSFCPVLPRHTEGKKKGPPRRGGPVLSIPSRSQNFDRFGALRTSEKALAGESPREPPNGLAPTSGTSLRDIQVRRKREPPAVAGWGRAVGRLPCNYTGGRDISAGRTRGAAEALVDAAHDITRSR
jgi:hypothetical protein